MKRWLLVASLALPLSPFACSSGPSTQDTRTNWLRSCDKDAECGTELSCVCGVCTITCDSDVDCEDGVCSSPLATAIQCPGIEAPEPICLSPEEEECTAWPLPVDNDLGQGDASECEDEGAVLCQSFDAPPPEWTSVWEGGPVSIQNCEVYQGAGALRFEGVGRQMRLPFEGTIGDGDLFLRARVRLSEDAEFEGNLLTLFSIRHQREGDIGERMALNVFPTGALELAVLSNVDGERYFPGSEGQLPRGEWACIVMDIDVDDTAGAVTVSVNDTPALVQTAIDTRGPDPFEMLVVTNGEGLTAGEYYVDELVVSSSPLDCSE